MAEVNIEHTVIFSHFEIVLDFPTSVKHCFEFQVSLQSYRLSYRRVHQSGADISLAHEWEQLRQLIT